MPNRAGCSWSTACIALSFLGPIKLNMDRKDLLVHTFPSPANLTLPRVRLKAFKRKIKRIGDLQEQLFWVSGIMAVVWQSIPPSPTRVSMPPCSQTSPCPDAEARAPWWPCAQQVSAPAPAGTAAQRLPTGPQLTLKSLSTAGAYGWKSRSDVLLVNAHELYVGWQFSVDSWLKKSPPQSNQPVSSKGTQSAQEWRVMICPWSYCYLRFY